MQKSLLKTLRGCLLLGLSAAFAATPEASTASHSSLAVASQGLSADVSALNMQEGPVSAIKPNAANDLQLKQVNFLPALLMLSLTAALALVFVVLRCYKAIGSAKTAVLDGRRLAVGGNGDEEDKEDPCGVSYESWLRWAPYVGVIIL